MKKIIFVVIIIFLSITLKSNELIQARVDSLININEYSSAIKILEKESIKNGLNENNLYSLSKLFYSIGIYKSALIYIDSLILLDSKNPQYYNSKASIYSMLEKNDSAMFYYSKAIGLEPDEYFHYYNRSAIYYKLEDMDLYCKDLEKSKNLLLKIKEINNFDSSYLQKIDIKLIYTCNKTNSNYYMQRGIAYYNKNQMDSSVNIYLEGLKKFPRSFYLNYFLGNSYAKIENFKKAQIYYKNALNYQYENEDEIELIKNIIFQNPTEKDVKEYMQNSIIELELHYIQSSLNSNEIENLDTFINNLEEKYKNVKNDLFNINFTLKFSKSILLLLRNDLDSALKIADEFVFDYPSKFQGYFFRGIIYLLKSPLVLNKKMNVKIIKDEIYFGDVVFNDKIKNKKNLDSNINNALSNFKKSLLLNRKNPSSYYYIGIIEKLSNLTYYCDNILIADELGLKFNKNIFKECFK